MSLIDHDVDDAYVLMRWLSELTSRTPDPVLVASLEMIAEDRGWHPYDAWRALTAATFDANVHPRGRDGKFIEKLGMVKLSGKVGGFGRKTDVTGQRGQVVDIIPDPKGGQPKIRVKLTDKNGREGTIDVTPDMVEQAPEKARLDGAPAAPAADAGKSLDELRAMSVDDLNAEIARLEAEGADYRDERVGNAVMVRNNMQNAAAPAPAALTVDDARKSLTDLANSPDIRQAVDLQRVQSFGGQSFVRDIDKATADLATADASNIGQRADALVTALERLRTDLRSQQGAPGSTIGIESRGIEMSSDRIKIQALDRAINDARDKALKAKSVRGSLTAAKGGLVQKIAGELRSFNPDLHPRAKDGEFIESGGTIRLEGTIDTPGGGKFDATGIRGQVDAIIPDKKNPGQPTIRVRITSPDGKKSAVVDVKPNQVTAAPEKARIPGSNDAYQPGQREPIPLAPDATGWGRGGTPNPKPAPGRDLAAEADTRIRDERRLAGEEVRGADDAELARQTGRGPQVWRQAVETEKANRANRRAADEVARQKLMADVNAQAANLSTTDAEERAKGLDDILAKLRFSIIDTDKIHDHVYPPGEAGRWTDERAAQHEQMWDDLLSQIEAADIPRDRDALVLGGLPGAGKSYMLRPGQKADSFGVVSWEPNGPLPEGATHVSINPDIVKEMLIARGMLPKGISADLKPMEQVTFLHEESSDVAKMFSARLGKLGYNIVLDNTMDSEQGMLKRMTPLARHGYKFRGLFADIPQDESLASAKKRYIDSALTPVGGRFVPSSVQGNRASSKGNLSKNRDAMDNLVAQDWFTEWMIVDNTGVSNRTPKGEVVAQGTGTGTAADRYLPGHEAAAPKAGPIPAVAPVPAPTIDVNAPVV